MAGLAGLNASKEAGKYEDNLIIQAPFIKMIQHVVQLVESVYPQSIIKLCLSSNDDILTKSYDMASRIQFISYIVKSPNQDEVFNLLCEYVEDEISFADKMSGSVCFVSPDDTEHPCSHDKYVVPIYSSEVFDYTVMGLYMGIHAGRLAPISGERLYVDLGFNHSKRGIILLNGNDSDVVERLREINSDGDYTVIPLNNVEKYANLLGCVRLCEENSSKL